MNIVSMGNYSTKILKNFFLNICLDKEIGISPICLFVGIKF